MPVPERIHRTFKARSALAGKSLSDFILDELAAIAALPSAAELRERGVITEAGGAVAVGSGAQVCRLALAQRAAGHEVHAPF